MTATIVRKPLDFAVVDDIAFAAERGRLDPTRLPAIFVANRLGPYLELLQLERGGGLPDLRGSPRFEAGPLSTLRTALESSAGRWVCPRAHTLGVLKSQASTIDWTTFAMDAKRAAMTAGLTSDWAAGMVAAIEELRDNIGEHSGSPETGYVAFRATAGEFEFVASDLGVGVLATLKGAPEYRDLTDHGEALRLTLTEGASRFGFQEGRGFGFRPLFTGLANRSSTLRFRSGNASLRIDGTSPSLVHAQLAAKPAVKGLFASVACLAGSAARL